MGFRVWGLGVTGSGSGSIGLWQQCPSNKLPKLFWKYETWHKENFFDCFNVDGTVPTSQSVSGISAHRVGVEKPGHGFRGTGGNLAWPFF